MSDSSGHRSWWSDLLDVSSYTACCQSDRGAKRMLTTTSRNHALGTPREHNGTLASSQSSDAASRRGMYSHFAGAADSAQTNILPPASKLELEGSVDALGSPRILLRPSPLDTESQKDWLVVPNGRPTSSSSGGRASRFCESILLTTSSANLQIASRNQPFIPLRAQPWSLERLYITRNLYGDLSYKTPQSPSTAKRGLFGAYKVVDSTDGDLARLKKQSMKERDEQIMRLKEELARREQENGHFTPFTRAAGFPPANARPNAPEERSLDFGKTVV